MVIYGCFTAARIAANNFWILYKDGGRTEIHLQFPHPDHLFLENFSISEDMTLLYCTQSYGDERYVVNLEKGTVEVTASGESETNE